MVIRQASNIQMMMEFLAKTIFMLCVHYITKLIATNGHISTKFFIRIHKRDGAIIPQYTLIVLQFPTLHDTWGVHLNCETSLVSFNSCESSGSESHEGVFNFYPNWVPAILVLIPLGGQPTYTHTAWYICCLLLSQYHHKQLFQDHSSSG